MATNDQPDQNEPQESISEHKTHGLEITSGGRLLDAHIQERRAQYREMLREGDLIKKSETNASPAHGASSYDDFMSRIEELDRLSPTQRSAAMLRLRDEINAFVTAPTDPMESLIENLDTIRKDVEGLFDDSERPDETNRSGLSPFEASERFKAYIDFDEHYNELQANVDNFITDQLSDIITSMIYDLYDFGMMTSNPDNPMWSPELIDEEETIETTLGPDGYVYLMSMTNWDNEGFIAPTRIRTRTSGRILNSDAQLGRAHLRNVLILHLLRLVNSSLSQKRISELTKHSQSKISLDLFMAKQLLQEAWLEELLDATRKKGPHIEILLGPFGCGGLDPIADSNHLNTYFPPQPWEADVPATSLDDRYDRWERSGFGYCLIRNSATSEMALLSLTLVDSLEAGNLAEVVTTATHAMLLYAERKTSELSRYFDDPNTIFSLPLVHLISTGNYSESRLIDQDTLYGLLLKGETAYPAQEDIAKKFLPLQEWLETKPRWQIEDSFWTDYLVSSFSAQPGHETARDTWKYRYGGLKE